jgi:hypothetical protein|tara:strand:+ start:191 stop:694 length:504 start_codon:yes stop_codon:yes gene_type:complete
MQKKVLSEIGLYYGSIAMPKGFEIDPKKLTGDIFYHKIYNTEFPVSKTLDMLQAYLTEHINLKYGFTLIPKETTGDFFTPQKSSLSMLQVDPVDLKNSPDYVMLYGVDTKDCIVAIDYDDNRRKGRSWEIPLKSNDFVMFPSTQRYYIKLNKSEHINFVLTTTYEFI